MKSKDLQNVVLSKYKHRHSRTETHKDLHGSVSLSTIEEWFKVIRSTSRITLLKATSHLRIVRTEVNIRQVKHRHDQLRVFWCRRIVRGLRISRTSAQRILKDDLNLQSYRKKVRPKISEDQEAKILKFANWIRTHFRKETIEIFVF